MKGVEFSLVVQLVKNPPAMQETLVRFLGWEDPLEKEMAIHSSTLAWKIPWTRSLICYSPWGHKELDMTVTFTFRRKPCTLKGTKQSLHSGPSLPEHF